MNDDLLALMKAKKVNVDDARRATTDRLKFLDMFK
jgi:twitching motility protein PilT